MRINASWSKEIPLNNGAKQNMIYALNLSELPEKAGCYVIFNCYGDKCSVLYIGQAKNIRARFEQQLNNVKLMMGINNHKNGQKKVIFCTLSPAQGQSQRKALDTLEASLIKHSMSEGHELLNLQGTKISYDSLIFKGNRTSEKMFSRAINIEKR